MVKINPVQKAELIKELKDVIAKFKEIADADPSLNATIQRVISVLYLAVSFLL